MKVTPNKLLKTDCPKLRFHQEKQVLQLCGNCLCIRSMLDSKSLEPDFITLGRSNPFEIPPFSSEHDEQPCSVIKVYDYLSSNNHQSVYTIQLVKYKTKTVIEICSYYLRQLDSNSSGVGYKAERKKLQLSEIQGFVPLEEINSIQLIPQFFNNSVVYVVTKTNKMECYCINLVDMSKLKVYGAGFIPVFQYATTSAYDDGELSMLAKNTIKRIKIQQKQQAFTVNEEKLPKKLVAMNANLIRHHWLGYNRLILATQKQFMVTESQNNNTPHEILCTIPVLGDYTEVKIIEMLVIRKNVLIFLSNLEVKVYVDESDDDNYKYLLAESKKIVEEPQLKNEETTIVQVMMSKNMEELLISLSNGQYFYSKFQGIQLGSEQSHLIFDKAPLKNFNSSKTGNIYASTAQNFCLVSSQKKIEIWDLDKITIVNEMQFDIENKLKTIEKCTMNPDGHSLCVAFPDVIRFYRLLINKIKQYSEFYIKNCYLIQYSHGGQMLAVCAGKNNNAVLTVIHTLKMKEVCNFKIGFTAKQIVWNQHDDEVYVSSKTGNLVNIYKISTKSKQNSILLDNAIEYMRYDFSTNKLVISTVDGQVKLIDQQNCITGINPQVEGFSYMFPSDGLYFVTTHTGKLYYSANINFEKKYEIPIFSQKFDIQYRKGCLIAYTNPSNVLVLKVKVKSNNKQNPEPQIENIMLVEKDQITKIFEKTKYIESQLDQLQNVTNVKLDDERKRYNELLQEHCLNFKRQIKEMNKRFVDLQMESSKTDKHSQRKFQELETGQIRAVNELEKVYDRKIKMQKDKYLELEQQAMEEKMRYESMLSRLEERYHQDIEAIRKQYTEKLQEKAKQIQIEKSKNLGYKKKLETKLIDLEQENQLTLFQLQNNKDNNIKNLIEKNTRLEKERDQLLIQIHNMNDDHKQLANDYERIQDKMKKNERNVNDNQNRVIVLEKEIERRQKMIEEKNITIEQQTHQIAQLEKSKHVLTFRTFEIRKTLEPKQILIDKLKADLMDLEEESKIQNKQKYQLSQKVEKYQKIIQTLRKQNSDIKYQFKKKETLHKNLCSDVYKVINNIDPKEWNTHFVGIYQNYVKEQTLNNNVNSSFKNDPTSEQINRHLVHVQQSLQQVATGNQKMLEGKKKQVQKKMKQNAELIFELNVMRKKQNQHINEIKNKNILISRLKRQNKEARQLNKTTRANTAHTGFTRRNPSRDPANISKGDIIDLNLRRQSEYLIPDRKGGRSRIISANRTMATREQSRKQRTKISDMARELQFARSTMNRQQRIIEQLNQQLLGQIQQP